MSTESRPQPPEASPEPLADAAASAVRSRLGRHLADDPPAELAVVAGSGLGLLATAGRELAALPFGEIPGLGEGSVAGHAGRWLLLERDGRRFHCLCGRRHLYEGAGIAATAHAMRVLTRLGVRRVLLTNAAGGLGARLRTGDLLLIRDCLNLMFCSPLTGRGPDEARPDLTRLALTFDRTMGDALRAASRVSGIELKEGVFAAVRGPSYETPAEVRAFDRLGADAVGMSTVPEALAASAAGLRVAAISLITNSHVADATPPSHAEVLAVAREAGLRLKTLLEAFLANSSI